MKRLTSLTHFAWYVVLVCSATIYSCKGNEDLYDPDVSSSKDVSTVFDFTTSKIVSLNIDYGYKGCQVLFQIFKEDPLNENGTRNSVEPVFKAYTNNNCQYIGKLELPTNVTSVYLYTDYLGLPVCIPLTVENNTVKYAKVSPSTKAATRTEASLSIGGNYWRLNSSYNLYALYDNYNTTDYSKWGRTLYYGESFWVPSNSKVKGLFTNADASGTDSYLGSLLSRVSKVLYTYDRFGDKSKKDNSVYVKDDAHVNTTVLKNAHIDLVFLTANGQLYQNAMSYYYYPTGKAITVDEIKALPKYVVFPRTGYGPIPNQQVKVRLQFFGANYNEAGTETFPAGYTIGWMLIPDILDADHSAVTTSYVNPISSVNDYIITAYKNNGGVYSNHIANTDQLNGFITLYDATAQKSVIGIEDMTYKGKKEDGRLDNDQSFEDMLFYVDADPVEAIYDPDQPIIPDEKPTIVDVEDISRFGTYAFEDVWPKGGDYDLNDVVIEYSTNVTFNGDNVKKIVDTYKIVSKVGSATKKDAFGFIIKDTYGGTITCNAPNFLKETENQYLLFTDSRNEIGKTYTVTRTFSEGNYPSYSSYQRNYNPFIVTDYVAGNKNRTEVHLPKAEASPLASSNNTGDNAYYVNKDGTYPFSINLYQVSGFTQVTELSKIGSVGEYPLFNTWAQSKGTSNTDWYLYKNGK
jgi:hypothetical protein